MALPDLPIRGELGDCGAVVLQCAEWISMGTNGQYGVATGAKGNGRQPIVGKPLTIDPDFLILTSTKKDQGQQPPGPAPELLWNFVTPYENHAETV